MQALAGRDPLERAQDGEVPQVRRVDHVEVAAVGRASERHDAKRRRLRVHVEETLRRAFHLRVSRDSSSFATNS